MPEIEAPIAHAGDSISALLGLPIPEGTAGMKMALRTLDTASVDILEARVKAGSELSNKSLQYLHPKDKDLNDMDRRIMVEAHVREFRANYELLLGYEKLIAQRIQIIRELLNDY